MPRARDHTLRSLGAGILAAWLTAPAAADGPVNVFLMVSDGQGFHAVGATTLYRGAPPVYQDFPVKVAVQTHSASQPAGYDPGRMWSDFGWALRGATDSAAAATAMVSGIKVRDGQLNRSPDGRPLRTFFEDASRLGMATGAISSVPFAHATPAAAYAHSMSRNDYPAIAREGILGDWLDVLIGAGHPGHDVNGEPRQPEPGHYDHVGGFSGFCPVKRNLYQGFPADGDVYDHRKGIFPEKRCGRTAAVCCCRFCCRTFFRYQLYGKSCFSFI